jgi:hypothetical protein
MLKPTLLTTTQTRHTETEVMTMTHARYAENQRF